MTERDTPKLQPAKPETTDSGKVRLGSAGITASFPLRQRPDPKTADRGTVRLGSAGITATFPPR